MSSINFDNVYLLLIALPLAAMLLVPFFITVNKVNKNMHNVTSAILHVALAVVIAFSAAGTKIETVITETDVYVLADVSYSANSNLDKIDEYIKNIKLPRNSKMGVVTFGKEPDVLVPMGGEMKSVKQHEVDQSQTNITAALEFTASLFEDDVIKRIIVITDGKQTDETDANALKRTVENIRAAGIYVDAMFLDDNISENVREVQVSNVEYTQIAYLNHEETATVFIQSSYQTSANVVLYKKGGEFTDLTETDGTNVPLSPGLNSVTFYLDTSVAGTYTYEVRVEADEDTSVLNNSYLFTQEVSGELKVLLLTENKADESALKEMYGENANIKSYVSKTAVPYSVEDLCEYDEIVLSDVDISKFDNKEMFIESLDTVVSQFGKSLVTLGNTYIQNSTEEVLIKLNDILPVRYGNSEQDPKLYTFVLDLSRSMFEMGKAARMKESCKRLLNILNDEDSVSVITFWGDNIVLVPPTEAKYRTEIMDKIDKHLYLQGTVISGALELAYRTIINQPFDKKQVMLISDGLFYDTANEVTEKASALYRYGIYTSVIDVGRDNSQAAATAKTILENVAKYGGGNYYYANDESALDDVFFRDIPDDITETEINYNCNVNVNRAYDDVVKGLDVNKTYVSGFLVSKAKLNATTVLSADYLNSGGGNAVAPLYSYWKYGNGKVSSFTSKLSGDWTKNWQPKQSFFKKVLDTNIPEEKIDYPYSLKFEVNGKYASVEISPATVKLNAVANIKVTAPNGEEISGGMNFNSSSYTYNFVAEDVGAYGIEVTYSYGGNDYVANLNYNIPYLPEYNAFAVFDEATLHKMIGGDGVVSNNGELTVTNNEAEVALYTFRLAPVLLTFAAVLFVADIVVRKLKWNDITGLFKKISK